MGGKSRKKGNVSSALIKRIKKGKGCKSGSCGSRSKGKGKGFGRETSGK